MHFLSEGGLPRSHCAKVQAITSWPTPTNQNQVPQFLGLCNYYRRFIQDFATMAKPLHRLTEKTCEFQWSDQCAGAFRKLKQRLSQAPILASLTLPKLLSCTQMPVMMELGRSSHRRMMAERWLLHMPVGCSARQKGATALKGDSCWLSLHSFNTSTHTS